MGRSFFVCACLFIGRDVVMVMQVVMAVHAQLCVAPGGLTTLGAPSGTVAAVWRRFFGGFYVEGLVPEVDVPRLPLIFTVNA